MNVDSRELDKFNRMADDWWDRNGPQKSLHDINPLRLAYIRRRAHLENAEILDAACGGGILSEALAKAGARVTGIDMGAASLEAAKAHAAESGLSITYQMATVEAMAAASPGRFDVVTCMELLEHVPEPASIVRSCGELVRSDGDIFFATLNRTLKSFVFAIIGAEYVLRLLPVGTHSHRRFVKPSELSRWAKSAGLTPVDWAGLQYNPFSRRYYLNRNISVNYMVHLRRKS